VLLKVILPLVQSLCEFQGDVRPLLARTIQLRAWMDGAGARAAAAAAATGAGAAASPRRAARA
jgi:hypothetical protein